jgi:[Skp1-protein]-hydroxyproline N-acetylglucosaminyltransferase
MTEGGSSAWNILDQAMEGTHPNFCNKLLEELHQAKLFDKLLPARTQGDARTQDLLSLLQQTNLVSPNVQQELNQEQKHPPVRGDKSLFLSRDYRSRPDFSARHPQLDLLISTVSKTLQEQLSDAIDLDLHQTSVQLAVYPGDGSSCYVRHCDRGQDGCIEESSLKNKSTSPQRIVTAIYYLTDPDWSERKDGGSLLVFSHDNNSVAVPPYRDRLIVFRSDGVEHQVLPSLRRPRTAITMWFYGTVKESAAPTEMEPSPVVESIQFLEGVSMTSIASIDDVSGDPSKMMQESARRQSSQLDGPPPLPVTGIKSQDDSDDESLLPTIFVSIASYRDSETYPTIQSLFSNAKYANRVKVGLVLQYDETQDASIWNQIMASPWYQSDQIRCLRMDDRHALGPCYARSLCQSLFRDETFVMQTDSHMRFRRNWDEHLVQTIEMLMVEQGEKVLLTAYPVGYQLPNNIPNETRGTVLVPWKFDSSGMLRQRGRLLQPRNDPVPCYLYAAGFNFGPGRMLQDVPYDQSLHHLFFGEEMSMAVRLYTHGYHLFAPPESVCYHLWSRDHRPTKPNKEKQDALLVAKVKEQSLAVVMNQLSGKCSTTVCGLGTVRTVGQFAEALGVDFGNKTLMKGCESGTSQPREFVDSSSSSSFAPDSLEAKVATLDAKSLERIAFFLGGW